MSQPMLDSPRRPMTQSPDGAGQLRPAVTETHCATVVFIGEFAYKMKKALDLGFVDWRSPGARRSVCYREVELNRQFAPDVYLGVAEVHGPDGEVCEWLVVMRRMPAERRLASLLQSGEDVRSVVREVARRIASHHAVARRSPTIDTAGTAEAVEGRWSDNLAALRGMINIVPAASVEEAADRALRYIRGRRALFAARVEAGLIRDGHGDVLADDIFCLDDGPRVLDCLEFDDRLRAVDGIDDAACLAMDLERLGSPHLGMEFLAWFKEFSGHSTPPSLVHHYIAYRAIMRSKVLALKAGQGDPDASAVAGHLLRIGLEHLRAGEPRLILVGGLPGTGKSTIAGGVADRLGAVLLRSDRLRKEMMGIDPATSAATEWQQGIYNDGHTTRVYNELCHRAAQLLSQGESVVLDATWSSEWARVLARQSATSASATIVEIRTDADARVADERVRERATSDPSDASPSVAAQMRSAFHPWPQAESVSTMTTVDESLNEATKLINSTP